VTLQIGRLTTSTIALRTKIRLMKINPTTTLFVALAAASLIGTSAIAATLTIQIVDAGSAPAMNAVAYAEPASGQPLPEPQRPAQIEQKSRQFAPLVTVVQTGAAISFPNHDTVRHHAYSFSPAKIFELKLNAGIGGDPIIFDKPGTVVVGCNIHDQMAASIQIVDTPYFAKSDASGKAVLENILPGKYRLKIRHPNQSASLLHPEQLVTIDSSDVNLPVTLNFKTQKKQD
jgi:plastocyanin